jgi:hypothetical protein
VSCDRLSPGAPSNGGFRHSRNFRYPLTLAASGLNGSGVSALSALSAGRFRRLRATFARDAAAWTHFPM